MGVNMGTYNYFSERYKDIIIDGEFCDNIGFKEQYKLVKVMVEFAAPIRYQPGRYDSWTVTTNALDEAFNVFAEHRNWGNTPENFECDEEILCKRSLCELFDVIEIQYEQLSSESIEYQSEVNNVLDEIDSQFRLMNGRFIKIDKQQFDFDLKRKALAKMEKLRCDEPIFQSAYQEILEAYEKYELGDYKDCILKAEYSFESMMKILLNNPSLSTSAANALIEALATSDYFSDIPENAKGIIKDKVLLSLPTVRNKCGSGHGQGDNSSAIPKSVATLALNLASTLNTFLADLYLEKNSSAAVNEILEDSDLPF
jgi:hypothetical protein